MTSQRLQRLALLALTIALASCGATRAVERPAEPSLEERRWAMKVESIDSSLLWVSEPALPPARRARVLDGASELERVALAD